MTGKLLQLGAINPGISTVRVAFNSIASVINALLQASTENVWLFLGATAAQADGNATPITTYPAALNSKLAEADRLVVMSLTADTATIAGMGVNSFVEGVSTDPPDQNFRMVSGRLVSESILSGSLDLPSGRESWGSVGQLIEDVVSGLVGSVLGDAFIGQPVAILFDQTDKTFRFIYRSTGTIDWDATVTMSTFYATLAPDRTTGAGFFEG